MRTDAEKEVIRHAWECDKEVAKRYNISYLEWYRRCINDFAMIPVVVGNECYGGFAVARNEIHAYVTKPFPLRRYFKIVQFMIDKYGSAQTMSLKDNQKACKFLRRLGFVVTGETDYVYNFECRRLADKFAG